MKRILIMAGGTGGHVIPALAVARELGGRGIDVSWLGSRGGMEERLVVDAGLPFNAIEIKGARNKGLARLMAMPFMLLRAMFQSWCIIRRYRPDAVLGMGGFAAGPGGAVSAMLRLPLLIHEQNSVAGLTNRWLAKISHRVMTGFPVAEGIGKFTWTGNPVRAEISAIDEPAERYAGRTGSLRILIVGGSQGASVFNETLPRLLGDCQDTDLEVWHQCGKQMPEAELESQYRSVNVKCRVTMFIGDMAAAYRWCDVVICRAGAMTVSEICSAGVAAIFVPFPHAVSDHQARNAAYLVREGAAIMVRQDAFVRGGWVDHLREFASMPGKLLQLAGSARTLAKPQATATVADYCMEAMHA